MAAVEIVGRDEAGILVRLEVGIEDHHRDLGSDRLCHRLHQSLVIKRRQGNPRHPPSHEVLDDFYLLFAVALLEGPLPLHGHTHFVASFDGAGMDRLPELVSGALGNDRNPKASLSLLGAAAAGSQRHDEGDRESKWSVQHASMLAPAVR